MLEMWKKGNPLALLVGMYIDTATVVKSMEEPGRLQSMGLLRVGHD